MRRFITSTHMTPAHALRAATSTCAITPTAAIIRIPKLAPCTQGVYCLPGIYIYTYTVIPYAGGMNVPFVFTPRALCTTERNALPSAPCTSWAPRNLYKRSIPYCHVEHVPQRTAVVG